MTRLPKTVATVVAVALGLVCLPASSSAQKALVYCPPVDATGCDNIVAALAATGGPFPGGVDRGYDGNGGTVSLASADLSQYAAFVVPSLADDSASAPYALLRDATIASRLNAVLGKVVLWSGTPDMGSANSALKETLLRNLAGWASAGGAAPRTLGLVALQDFSDDEAHRYGWITALTGRAVSADTVLQAESGVQTLTSTGATILDNAGTPLSYANLASFGFGSADGWTVDANGSAGGEPVLMTSTAIAVGGTTPPATVATVTTDKPDYPPFDTVTISGTGWQPGETVALFFHETPQNHLDRTITTVADASGNISNRQYSTDDLSLNVSIALTATGQSSGRIATVTFTDGPCVGTVTVGPQNPTPIAASGSGAGAATATFPVTVSRKNGCGTGSGGTPFSVNLTATGFPSTGSLSPSTLAFSATDPSKSATLTLTIPATVAPKAYGVTVTATNTTSGGDNSSGLDSLRVTGGVGSVAVGAQSPSPLPAGHAATYTVTVNRGSSTGNFTASLAASGLPAGASGTFSPTSVSFTSSAQTSQTSTLTITSIATLAAGNYGFSVSATNPLIPADAATAAASLVTSSPATKLAFSTAAFTVRVGLCSPKITIVTQNASGVATNPASPKTIVLSTTSTTSPGGQFFSDPSCASAITSVAIPTSANSADFYYMDGTAGGPTLTVTDNDVSSPLTSATQKETISPLPATTTVVTTSGSPSTFGQEVTFTATVAPTSGPGTPTGTVQFSIDGVASGAPVALANGVATLKISTLSATKHPVAAAYSGDANFASSTGQLPNNQQMVSPASTATTVASSKNPSNPGESVTFSATVTAQAPGVGTPTGTVQLKVDGTNSGSPVALAGGNASFPATSLATTGTHVITVVYANQDGNFTTSTGTLAGGQIVQQTPTTLTVAAATGTFGGTTTLSATLATGAGGLAGQSVTFTLNGNAAGSATTNASGVATVNNVSLAGINAGVYATGVSASFAGGGAFGGSTGSGSLTVSPASQTITFNTTGLPAKKFGDPVFSVASFASASSGLAVSFTSTTNPVCTVTTTGDVTIVAAGACTLTASQAGNTNFQAAPDVPSTITIGKAAATLAIDPASLQGTFNGSPHVVTVTTAPVTGLTVVSITYAGSPNAPVDAGSYAVVATLANANYDASVPATGTLVIDKATPTVAWATPANIVFGTALGSTQLDATAKGVGGSALDGVFTYAPDAGVKLDAGTHTLSVSFAPTDSKNYNSVPATTVSLTVIKASQTIAFDASTLNKKFGDPNFSVAGLATASSGLAVTFASTTLGTCSVSSTGDVSIAGAGVCSITASQAGNSNFEAAPDVSSSFTIAKGVATLAIDAASLQGTYNGSPHVATVSTTPTGLSGVSITYAGSATAPVDAGSYAVVASLTNANYDAQDASGTMVIAKATPTVAWATPSPIVYLTPLGSTQLDATATGVGGASLAGTFTYTPAAGEVLHAGTHTLSVGFAPTDSKNYNGVPATTVQLTVLKADQTITFAPLAKKTYGDAPFSLSATASSNLAVTYATAAPCSVYGSTLTIKGAGSCTITASQAGNDDYNKAPDVNEQQLIDKAPLTIAAENAEKVYGAALPTLAVKPAAFVNGDSYASLTTPVSLSTTATAASPVVAGGYPIIPSGATSDNYDITFVNGTLTVTPAPLTITADDKQKVYGDPLPAFSVQYASFVNGDGPSSLGGTLAFASSATAASSVAGSPYSITPSGLTSTNYSITFAPGKLTITPAPLTITADDKQKVYGAALPVFTVKPAAFVNGDTYASLVGTLGFDTPATSGSPVVGSPYPITPKGLTSTNYTITFAPGNLTVTPAPLTITADDKQKVYGAALPTFTVHYATFVNNDNAGNLGGTLGFDTPATSGSPVVGSPYPITPKGLTSTNYTITFASGNLTVTPAPLTVAADDKQKVYGDPLPTFTVKPAAFVNNDTYSSLGGTLVFQTAATQASTVLGSPYAITPGGLTSTNYTITFAPGNLTVTPAPLTVTALNKQKVFDGLPYPFTSSDVTYSGFVLGQSPSVLGGTLSFSQGATIQVGSYSNAPQGLTSSNYAITFVPGQLTILAWTLAGFYQPVDMSTGGLVYNTVKGGSTVPLKFNIYQATQANTNERTDVGAVKSFSATPYVCTSSATDEIEIVTTGGTTLRYDTTGQQFIQNWLTPKSPGTCYQVIMTALDGSKLTAFFKLK